MGYVMAFVVGVFINLSFFKLKVWWAIRNAERFMRSVTITYHWKKICFDVFWWGLLFLVAFAVWTYFH